MATKPTKAKRSQIATLINTTPDETTATYAMLGYGITTGEFAYNPKTEAETYINEDTATTDVIGYEPSLPIESAVVYGDPAYDYADGLRIKRALLDEAVTDIVNVWLYKTAESGSYPAEKQVVAAAIETFGGAGGEKAKLKYTLYYQGNPIVGTFNPSTNTFTATSGG